MTATDLLRRLCDLGYRRQQTAQTFYNSDETHFTLDIKLSFSCFFHCFCLVIFDVKIVIFDVKIVRFNVLLRDIASIVKKSFFKNLTNVGILIE